MTIEALREFFGWCFVLNIDTLILLTILILMLRNVAVAMHRKIFKLDEAFVNQAYYTYLGDFKIMTIVFSLVPYLALSIIG